MLLDGNAFQAKAPPFSLTTVRFAQIARYVFKRRKQKAGTSRAPHPGMRGEINELAKELGLDPDRMFLFFFILLDEMMEEARTGQAKKLDEPTGLDKLTLATQGDYAAAICFKEMRDEGRRLTPESFSQAVYAIADECGVTEQEATEFYALILFEIVRTLACSKLVPRDKVEEKKAPRKRVRRKKKPTAQKEG